jgi:hypothetical protein
MEDLPLSTDPPAAPRLTPRIAPGRSPNAPFGQQAARGPTRCLSDPPHCAGKRADRPEGKSSRKTPDPHPDRLPHERTRTGGGRHRTIGAPCGRQSPADCTSGSGDPRFREAPLDAPKSSQRNQSTQHSSTARSAFRLCYPYRLAPARAASSLLTRCSFHSSFD